MIGEAPHPLPGQPAALTATPKRFEPVLDDPFAEGAERLDVVGHRVVVVVPLQDAGEPATLLWNGLVHTPRHLALTASSLARIRFESVIRLSLNRPVFLVVPQICVKP